MENVYGYVRVSSKDQCEDRQLLALQAFGVPPQAVFKDKLSGKDFDTRWAAITRRSRNSGGRSPKKRRPTSWCWICPCWTRGKRKRT